MNVMDNVVQFPATKSGPQIEQPQDELLTPSKAMWGLQRLWAAGLVSTVAHSIGTQALFLLATNTNRKSQFISMSADEMMSRYVRHNGLVLAGPPVLKDPSEVGKALADLHYECGILNQVDLRFFNQSGNPRAHFLSPLPNQRVPPFDDSARINFRLDRMPLHVFEEWVNKRILIVLAEATVMDATDEQFAFQ